VSRLQRLSRTPLLAAIALAGLGSVAVALWTQHGLGMLPCAWCVLQRLIFLSIVLVSLLGLAWRTSAGTAFSALLILLLSLSGAATALWQHFVAAANESCKLTLAERIISGLGVDGLVPEVFQPLASCADAAATLLGVPYEFWSFTVFVVIGVLASRLFAARRH
jgi:disulfide bond formation protein DsbB